MPCHVLPINTSVLRNTHTVVSAYQSNRTAAELIDAGRPTIASYGNYYLSSGDSRDWQSRYTRDPCDEIDAAGACVNGTGAGGLLIGGTASAWGESVNAANFDAVVWHGLLAVAERLWSPKVEPRKIGDVVGGAAVRLEVMSCYLRTRYGVPVGALNPGYCPADVRWLQ